MTPTQHFCKEMSLFSDLFIKLSSDLLLPDPILSLNLSPIDPICPINLDDKQKSNILDAPLLQSYYEKDPTNKLTEIEKSINKQEIIEKSLNSTIIKNSLNQSRSINKSLEESIGIKFVLKWENGKANYVPLSLGKDSKNKENLFKSEELASNSVASRKILPPLIKEEEELDKMPPSARKICKV